MEGRHYYSSVFRWGNWNSGKLQSPKTALNRLPTPVSLPGKPQGPRSLQVCSPWGRTELDTIERLMVSHFHFLSEVGACGLSTPCGLMAPESPVSNPKQSRGGKEPCAVRLMWTHKLCGARVCKRVLSTTLLGRWRGHETWAGWGCPRLMWHRLSSPGRGGQEGGRWQPRAKLLHLAHWAPWSPSSPWAQTSSRHHLSRMQTGHQDTWQEPPPSFSDSYLRLFTFQFVTME